MSNKKRGRPSKNKGECSSKTEVTDVNSQRDEDEDLPDLERIRRRNIEQNMQMMKELGIFKDRWSENSVSCDSTPSQPVRRTRKRKSSESSLILPTEKRRSRRLASLNRVEVQFTDEVAKTILGDANSCYVSMDEEDIENRHSTYDDFLDDLDKGNKTRKKIHRRSKTPREIPSVDEITEDDLMRVNEFPSEKVHSQDGTTCHQCRQKTIDQKTYCRSKTCFGVRGQFCGPCLRIRYGESVVEALKDPEWTCPPCRKLCNCSICRTQDGKIPTGQLYHLALERGYRSVRHFLEGEAENEED